METTKNSLFSRLMSIVFIAMGIFLGIYAFFANATTWTVGAITWDNSNYLSGLFRDNNPTTGDIITALYGSGDENTAYTQHRSGYNSGSCLNGGMSVEFTGIIPTTLTDHTIYVIASGSYDITTPIEMAECSALISSGTVILSGQVGSSPILLASEKNHIIIEKIRLDGTNTTGDGIRIHSGINFTINDIKTYNNHYNGIAISNSSYGEIRNFETYNNSNGVDLHAATNTSINTIDTHDNAIGIYLYQSSGNNLSGITSYDNSNFGVHVFTDSDYNMLTNGFIYDNLGVGLAVQNSDYNTLTNIDTHDNKQKNLLLNNAVNNILDTIIANGSQTEMGLYLSNSSGNIFSGVSAYGNYYAGVHVYNSSYNTGTNIISNSNSGGLYLENSSYNNFSNFTASNSPNNGVVFSGAHYNTLSGLVASGNMGRGVYRQSSNNNTISYSSVYQNLKGGIFSVSGDNAIFRDIHIYSNTGAGIALANSSGALLENLYVHDMLSLGAGIDMTNCSYSTITDSSLINNRVGIKLLYGHSNTISGSTITGIDILKGITLQETASNSINNIYVHGTGTQPLSASLDIRGGTGTSISLFSGNADILGYINTYYIYNSNIDDPGYIFDSYTTSNNYINFEFYPYASLTGNSIPLGSTFGLDFDMIQVGNMYYKTILSGVISLTVSGADRDGKIYRPMNTIGTKIANTGETGTQLISQFLETVEIISGSSYITINGGNAEISRLISSGTSGQFISILKSNDGNTWSINTPDEGCILDSMKICTFTTTGDIKLFTFGTPGMYFTGTTQSGTIITNGGYYNTGVSITFTGLTISGATLNGNPYYNNTLITTGDTYTFILEDNAGNETGITFTIDMTNPLVTGNYPISGLHISGINNIPFLRSGSDTVGMNNYTLSITGTHIYTGTVTGTTSTVYLPNGSYTRHVIAKDRAGNTGSSQVFPFIITAPYTGNIILTGPNAKYIGTQRFTKDWAGIYMLANDPTQYTISGAIDTSPLTGTFSSRAIHNVLLTGTNGAKDIFVTMDNGSGEIISKTFLVQLDTVAPIPTLTSPINGTNIAGTITLNRSAGPDAAGLSGYQYLISPTDTFGTIFHSGSTTTSSVTIPNGTISYTGTLYRKVIFIDRLGNTGSSATQSFNYTGGTTDITPSSFHFNDVTNADLDEIYASNTITITGMTPNTSVLASINRGALYISGHMVGVTGYVQNGRTVKIELNSSYKYDTPVESTLTIGGVSDTFKVTTKKGTSASTEDYEDIETDLSNTQKLMVIAIFETLKDLYGGDKEEEFFNTMLLMLDEKMDEYDDTDDEYIALKYLYDLIEQYYDDGEFGGDTIDLAKRIINGIYTAPNGKKYRITYDSSTKRFTSTNFVVPKYFPTLDTLKYIIDINNPAGSQYINAKPILARWKNANIDGTRQTSPYTAPNKKVFYFFKDITGKYSSYTFTSERYFNSLNEVKEFIYNSNKK